MKLISWNVNGLRAALNKGLLDFIAVAEPEVICLQETKAHPDQVEIDLPQYHKFWNSAEKKGYAGTTTWTKVEPMAATYGIGIAKHDNEGRVVTLEFPDYFLINVYTPNSQRELLRLDYRTREWDVDFLAFAKKLERSKPVIFCGDLNVAHTEIDLANPKANIHNHGFTPEERAGFDKIVQAGFIDTFREFHRDGGHYTWWSPLANARARNIGWRIDYFCISAALRPRLQDAFILPQVMGSDHCPIGIILK